MVKGKNNMRKHNKESFREVFEITALMIAILILAQVIIIGLEYVWPQV